MRNIDRFFIYVYLLLTPANSDYAHVILLWTFRFKSHVVNHKGKKANSGDA